MIGLIQTEKSNINFFRQKREMKQNEFKDRLFDILNETNNLPIQDLIVDDKNDTVNIYLTDGMAAKLNGTRQGLHLSAMDIALMIECSIIGIVLGI